MSLNQGFILDNWLGQLKTYFNVIKFISFCELKRKYNEISTSKNVIKSMRCLDRWMTCIPLTAILFSIKAPLDTTSELFRKNLNLVVSLLINCARIEILLKLLSAQRFLKWFHNALNFFFFLWRQMPIHSCSFFNFFDGILAAISRGQLQLLLDCF